MKTLFNNEQEFYTLTNIIVGMVAPEIFYDMVERGYVGGLYETGGVLQKLCGKYGLVIEPFDVYPHVMGQLMNIFEIHYSIANIK